MGDQTTTRTCQDCHADRTDVPIDETCPQCESTKPPHTHVILGLAASGEGALSVDQIVMAEQFPPPWTRKWFDVQLHLKALRAIYQRSGNDNIAMKVTASAFFQACWDMCDWLGQDPGLHGVTGDDAHNYAAKTILEVCGAFANTDKHHTLHRPDRTRAWISGTYLSRAGDRMEITYESSMHPARTIDALDLAEQCHQSWLKFFTNRGIPVPS